MQAKADKALEDLRLQKLQEAERVASAATAGPSNRPPDNLRTNEHSRRGQLAPSMVIRRLPEKLGETSEELQRAVSNLAPFAKGGAGVDGSRVTSIRRVGCHDRRPLMQFAGQEWLVSPRLVIVEFQDVESKMAVKQESWRLARGGFYSNVSLDHALTIEQQKLRAAQWPQIQEAKEKGWRWSWSEVAPHRLIIAKGGVADGST